MRPVGYGALTRYGAVSHRLPLVNALSTSKSAARLHERTLCAYNPAAPEDAPVWAGPVSLATTPGVSMT